MVELLRRARRRIETVIGPPERRIGLAKIRATDRPGDTHAWPVPSAVGSTRSAGASLCGSMDRSLPNRAKSRVACFGTAFAILWQPANNPPLFGGGGIEVCDMPTVTRLAAKRAGAVKLFVLSGFLALALLAGHAAHSQEWLYTVRPGDNLWNVTADYLTRMDYWPRLQALNQVSDPEHLPPGMKLRIPIAWLKRPPTTAQVLNVQGQAKATLAATNQTIQVSSGLFLQSGDTLHTGPDSNVTLEFGDGSRLLLQADSQLSVDTLRAYGPSNLVDTLLRLEQGRVESQVTPRPASGPRYEIWTPAAASAVRGTRYRLGMDPPPRLRARKCWRAPSHSRVARRTGRSRKASAPLPRPASHPCRRCRCWRRRTLPACRRS